MVLFVEIIAAIGALWMSWVFLNSLWLQLRRRKCSGDYVCAATTIPGILACAVCFTTNAVGVLLAHVDKSAVHIGDIVPGVCSLFALMYLFVYSLPDINDIVDRKSTTHCQQTTQS